MGSNKSFEENMTFTRKFLPEIKSICGVHFLYEKLEEDLERNSDLVTLKLDAVRVACRVRRHQYVNTFRQEFTVRSRLESGAKTELDKVLEGWGDFMFYGFADAAEAKLDEWFLGDLSIFRQWFLRFRAANGNLFPGDERQNNDGSSWFRYFKLADMPEAFVKDDHILFMLRQECKPAGTGRKKREVQLGLWTG
jgi:hypothetical protein